MCNRCNYLAQQYSSQSMWNLQLAEVASRYHDSIKMALWDVFSMVCHFPLPLGCKVLCYPSTFNMTTGPAHWEILVRSRYTYILLVQQSSLVCRPRPAFHRLQYGKVRRAWYLFSHEHDIVNKIINGKKIRTKTWSFTYCSPNYKFNGRCI